MKKTAVALLSICTAVSGSVILAGNAHSATCSFDTTALASVTAQSSISISIGMKFIAVDNPTPFISGMRLRAMTGDSLASSKFVEGQVGAIRDCVIGLYVDYAQGRGALRNARFSVTGLRGLRGPAGVRGDQGLRGITGLAGAMGAIGPAGPSGPQGVQGIQGVQGPAGTPGTSGTNGIDGLIPSFGSFYDTTTQSIDSINTPKAMTFNQVTPGVNGVTASRVSIDTGSRITVARSGTYNIQFSAQLAKTDQGNDTMDIWLRVNGVDVPWSDTEVTISSTQRLVASWNFMIDMSAGQYAQLMYSSADINSQILAVPAQTAPIRPGIPSVIVTVQQVQ